MIALNGETEEAAEINSNSSILLSNHFADRRINNDEKASVIVMVMDRNGKLASPQSSSQTRENGDDNDWSNDFGWDQYHNQH